MAVGSFYKGYFSVWVPITITLHYINTLILANSVIIKSITKSFIVLNSMMENENKSFTNISVSSDHDCRIMLYLTINSVIVGTFIIFFVHSIQQDGTST